MFKMSTSAWFVRTSTALILVASGAVALGCSSEAPKSSVPTDEVAPKPSVPTDEVAPKHALFVVTNVDTMTAENLPSRETGAWFGELTHPYLKLADAEDVHFKIDIASPNGGDTPIDAFSVKVNIDDLVASGGTVFDSGDPRNERFLNDASTQGLVKQEEVDGQGPAGEPIKVTKYAFADTLKLADVRTEDYDFVFFVGGNGVPWQYPDDAQIQRVAAEMYEDGKLVSSVCHGTSALLNVKLSSGEYLVKGKKLTGFSTAEEEALGQREMMPVLMEEEFPSRGALYSAAPPMSNNVIVDGHLLTGQNPSSAASVGDAIVTYFHP